LKIHAITHRRDPIFLLEYGDAVHEGQTATALIKGAEIYGELKSSGSPLRRLCPPYGVGHMRLFSTDVPFVNFAGECPRRMGNKAGLFTYYIVIVDADVDPTNMDEVLHAITTSVIR